jgi:hypothetical protein
LFADLDNGPVNQWGDQLTPNKPEGPVGREVLLSCRRLSLRQMGEVRGRRNIELHAVGKAIAEGIRFGGGTFESRRNP